MLYAETAGVDLAKLRDKWAGELTAAEGATLGRLRQAADQRDYLAAHALQRLALREQPASQHSLTHTRGLVACATLPAGRGSIGIDAEPLDAAARLATMADVVASPHEREQLDLVSTWVAKEAYLKSRGEGFSGPGGFAVLLSLVLAPGPVTDGWATVSLRDRRTGAEGRAWLRQVGQHLIAVVSSSATLPRLEQRTLI